MRVIVQTRISPPYVAYDSSKPSTELDKSAIRRFLKPVVQVQENDGTVLYKSGDFYPATGFYLVLGLVAALTGYGIYKMVK